MYANISRRTLLAGAGCAAAGSMVGQLLAVARAQEAAQAQQGQAGGICLSMIFEDGPKVKFDQGKFVKNHMPLLREVYGDSVERIELRTTAGSAMGVPSPVRASSTLWIKDVQGFIQKLQANAERITKDLDAVAKGNRLAQSDRIVLALGDARGDVSSNNHVFSLYYRNAPAGMGMGMGMPRGPGAGGPPGGRPAPAPAPAPATAGSAPAAAPAGSEAGAAPVASGPSFDQRYYVEAFLPKLYSLYGSNAIRRLEATVGMDQGGQKAAQVAAYHIYIRDRGAYDQQAQSAFSELTKDTGKFMQNLMPVFADMRVSGIA